MVKKSKTLVKQSIDPNKEKALEAAFAVLNKQFWTWTIMRMWNAHIDVKTISTWVPSFDIILWWGIPEWRIVEFYWAEASWKTSLALQIIAQVQKRWEVVAFIDAEHALNPQHAKTLWVDVDNLLLSQPDYGEQALQIAEELAKSWVVKLIVIDSVSALVPKAEVEGDMWDSHMWLQARMMSQGLRKLTSILSKTWTTIIFINQTRMKIGVMFGNPETTSGWTALKFFASQRVQISKGEQIKDDNKEASWHFLKIKVVKNKIAPPFKEASAQFLYNQWFDKLEILINVLLSIKEITQSWAYFKIIYKWTENKFQGRDKLKNWIIDNKLYDDLYKIAAKWLLDISNVDVDVSEIVWQDDEIE